MIQTKKILFALILSALTFFIMQLFFTPIQASLLAVVVLMITLWTNEALPLGVVSLFPIILFPALSIATTKATSLNFAHPIIYLFLGGFMIAVAVEKIELHKYIAHKMLSLFPRTARGIIFALIITSGALSSVLSNTTTTLLLLPIALFLSEDKKLKLRFVLGIAYGASIGGILTPIGTPPNLILMGLIQEMGMEAIPFMKWVFLVSPLVLVMFLSVGTVLGIGLKNIEVHSSFQTSALSFDQKKVLFLIAALIFTLVINAPIKPFYNGLGLSETGILLTAGLLLFAPPFNILKWNEDKSKIPFEIMFLFGAGFAIAMAFSKTGMADEIASYLLQLTTLSDILFMIAVALIITFSTEITSNTALISIMLPVLYSVSEQAGLNTTLFMMLATICASYAFMLPIATPPNAIAMSSGVVSIKTMASYGIIFNIIGIAVIVVVAEFFWKVLL